MCYLTRACNKKSPPVSRRAPISQISNSLFLDTAHRLRIPPDALDALLFFLYLSGALEAAVARPAGGAATDLNLQLIPPCGCERRIQRIVIAGEDHRTIIVQKRFNKLLVVGVAQFVFVAARLAGSGDPRSRRAGGPLVLRDPAELRRHVHAEEVDHAAVDIVVDLDLGRGLADQD